MPLTSVNKGQVNGHLPNSWWLITVWNINASFAISGGDGKTCIFLLWLILSEMITWRRKIAISSISDVRTATCTTKGSRCVCTWSKWTMAVVSTAGALVNIYKKGTTQVSVIITCITVFCCCFFFFWQGGNKLNGINYLMLDERKKWSQVWIDIVVLIRQKKIALTYILRPCASCQPGPSCSQKIHNPIQWITQLIPNTYLLNSDLSVG